jgi:YidC/Oxa1 family membrane protein insertase
MFGQLMYWIYTGISWILLRWHDLWNLLLGNGQFLGTNWDWILAVVFLVITVRVILFPIFVKQIRSQRAMQALQPKMKELQEKYKGDKETQRQEMMKLYQTEKVNPLMGCLPMFLQIPVFLGLFHVLKRLDPVQTKNTTIYGWTQVEWDSAARARLFHAPIPAHFASNLSELQILNANGLTVKIVAGVLILIMMATTFLTSRQMILKTGWNADPQQRMIQKLMLYGIPFSLLISGWYFPIGVIIYWVTQNLFSLGQQYWVLHKYPPPVTAGSIPMKSARKKAEPVAQRSFLARLVAPKDGDLKPSAPAGSRFTTPVQQPKSGLFRRRSEAPPTEPVVPESRSLAPKPGAKPTNPKQPAAEQPKPAPAKVPAKAAPAKALPAKAAPAKGPAKPVAKAPVDDTPPSDSNGAAKAGSGQAGAGQNGSAQNRPSQNGSASDDVPTNGAKPTGGAKPTPARSGSARSGGSKSTTAKKSASPRKGPANKKGGPRR